MPKVMTLHLGGKERTLKFGTMGFFKYVGEIIDGDPLTLFNEITNPRKQYELTFACIYAGLKCGGCELSKDEIDVLVQQIEFTTASEIIKTVQEAMLGGNGQVGEAEARALVEKA